MIDIIMSKKPFILVIDTDQILREKIAGLLSRREDVGIVSQTSCITSLENGTSGFCPDLILIGLRTFRGNRYITENTLSNASIGVYVYGNARKTTVERALMDSGIDGYVEIDELEETIHRLLEAFSHETTG